MADSLPWRRACRALILDQANRVLLAHHVLEDASVWACPGGGVEVGETLADALSRELHEEIGLAIPPDAAPTLVWIQTHEFAEMQVQGFRGPENHYFFLRTSSFVPAPGVEPGEPGHSLGEGISNFKWWGLDEIAAAQETGIFFSPRALPSLVRDVLVAEKDGCLSKEPVRLGL